MSFYEEQRRRQDLGQRQRTEAKGMSNAELRDALTWQQALLDHSGEIGDYSGGGKSKAKIEVIEAELRARGLQL